MSNVRPEADADEPTTAAGAGPSRRTVLRAVGLGGLALGVGALTWRASDQGVFTAGDGLAYAAWADPGRVGSVEALVGAAVLAASAHNMQNWRFVAAGDQLELFDDPTRSLGAVDPTRREADLGLGCALANLELAGPAAGLELSTALLPPGAAPDLVARVTFEPGESVDDDPLFEAIRARRSDRGPYPDEVPPLDVLDRVARDAVDGSDGVRVVWLTGADELRETGTVLVDAARALTADAAMSRDGFAWFRSDWNAVQRHKDGLTLDAQALDGPTTAIGKLLPPSSRSRGDEIWVEMTRDVHTATARAYGLVIADRTDRVARLRAGRALQRLHLGLTAQGWAMQHLNQLVEMSDRERALGGPGEFSTVLGGLEGGDDVVAMLRVGRPSGLARLSPRRPVDEVLER